MLNEYIIVTTFCNKEEIANKIHSKYWWNNELEECDEYKLEFRTKESLFTEIENEIKKIHDYEIAEISYYEIKGGNMEFLHWIDQNNLK